MENRLAQYRPYTKQREFHAAGTKFRERALIAGNQLGKTLSAGGEYAMHLTGRYPDWWPGRTYSRPIVGWVAGVTGETTRDNPQRMLFGRINALGTGMIPKDAIKGEPTRRRGVADSLDTAIIRWGGGGDIQAGESLVSFKSYDQGRAKFQGETIDLGWCDEEPPEDVYSEFLVRLQATIDAMMMATFTPLLGWSTVVNRFMKDKVLGTFFVQMGIRDVDHYSAERKAEIIAGYPAHEREARANGVPLLGSGAIFPVADESIEIEPFELPEIWPRLRAIDFGWDHPTAKVNLAYDRDKDIVYVYDEYRERELSPLQHAMTFNAEPDKWAPMAWPHDGNNDTAAGPQLAKQYREAGVPMLNEHAKYEEVPGDTDENRKQARNSVEAGVSDMLSRMQTKRLRVFKTCTRWFEEKRGYHRKDGKIVKLNDDLLSATRYGIMQLRFAIVRPVSVGRIDHNRRSSWR